MIKSRGKSIAILLGFVLSLCFCTPASGEPHDLSIGGREGSDPLLVVVADNGNLAVYQWDQSSPGYGDFAYINRYFDDFLWGTALSFFKGETAYLFYSDAFTGIGSFAGLGTVLGQGQQTIDSDANTIETVWDLPGLEQIYLKQRIRYWPGSYLVEKSFTLINESSDPCDRLRLIHGGNLSFRADTWQPLTLEKAADYLAITSCDTFEPRRIRFQAGGETPWSFWRAGDAGEIFMLIADSDLDNDVTPTTTDAACFVGWHKTDLAADEWQMDTLEDYSLVQAEPTPQPQAPQTETSCEEKTELTTEQTTAATIQETAEITSKETSPATTSLRQTAPEESCEDLPQTGEDVLSLPLIIGFGLLATAVCLLFIRRFSK